jgi:ribosomal protein S27AE
MKQENKMAYYENKMICPKCGTEMNHHADKLVDPVKPVDAKHINLALGGLIEEMHYCPGCGAVASRRKR